MNRCPKCFNLMPYCRCQKDLPDPLPTFEEAIDPAVVAELDAKGAFIERHVDEIVELNWAIPHLDALELVDIYRRLQNGDTELMPVVFNIGVQMIELLYEQMQENGDEGPEENLVTV